MAIKKRLQNSAYFLQMHWVDPGSGLFFQAKAVAYFQNFEKKCASYKKSS